MVQQLQFVEPAGLVIPTGHHDSALVGRVPGTMIAQVVFCQQRPDSFMDLPQ